MKTDRKIKAEPGSENLKINKKTRGSRAKSSSGTNGNSSVVTYEHAPIGIVECLPDGKHLQANEEFCRLLGYEKEELAGKAIKAITHEDDYPIDIKLHQQLVEGKIPFYRLEKRYIRKDGRTLWVELTRSVVRDAAGNPLYTIGVVLDISDRKHVEKVLRDSSERLRLATEVAQMFTWELDLRTQIFTFADNFEQVLGFSAGLMPKNSMEDVQKLSPLEDLQVILDAFAKAIENHKDLHALQYRMINPENGQAVWLEASAKIVYDNDGNAERMFGVTQNITEKKKAQEEILIISRMPEENPNPVMRLTRDGKVLYANGPSASLLKAWEGNAAQAIPDELQARVAEAFTSGLKKDIEIESEGKVFSATLAPILEAGYVNFYASDITERKRAEQSLKEFACQQEALYQLTNQLHRTNSLEDVFNAALDAIRSALQCDRASILLFDDQDVMHFVAWRGLSDDYRKATDGHSPWKSNEKNPEPICMSDVNTADLSDSLKAVIKREGIGALAFIPLVSNGKLIGKFMTYYNKPHVFHEDEVEFSLTIARQLAFGVDRRRAEEALASERELLNRLFETMPVMVSMYDSKTDSLRLNADFERRIGWKTGEVSSRSLLESIYPDPDYRMQVTQRMAVAGRNDWVEVQVQTRDGRTLDSMWSNISVLHGRQIGIGIDITERKRAEEALRANEALYRTIARSIPGGGVYVVDKDMRYLVADGAVTEAFGLSREMLEGHTVSEVFRDVQRDRMIERLNRNFAGETVSYETEYNGRVYWTQQAPLVESMGQAIIVTLDITERKQTEEALRQSEERFVQFMEHLPGLAWIKDIQGRYVYANAAAEEAFNAPREKLYGKTDQDIFPSDTANQFKGNDEQALLDEKGVQVVEMLPHNDGVLHYSLVNKFPIPGPDGEIVLIGGTAFDITERKQAEEALRESEESYRSLFNLVPVAVYTCDADGVIQEYNQRAVELWGREPAKNDPNEKYCGSFKIYYPDGRFMPHEHSPMARMLNGETLEPHELEVVVERPDGVRRNVIAHPLPIRNARGEIVEAINCLYDITERKQAEEALQLLNLQLESRVAVRTAELQDANMALQESRKRLQILSQRLVEVQEEERRAIARELHDRVGQSLSALNINMIIMRDQLYPDSLARVGPRLNDSMHLVGETITLVRDVMSNLRPAVLDDYGLEAALQSHVDEYMSRYEIKVVLERPAQPIPRLGPSIEMTFLRIAQEALMNIARHANASQVILSLWQEGDSVCLTIQDNGSGIVSWQQANRPGSHGLVIMRERAEAFGGNLKVASVPGKGTKIEMSIPVGRGNQNEVQKEMLE